jgi:hypothetical protein
MSAWWNVHGAEANGESTAAEVVERALVSCLGQLRSVSIVLSLQFS